MQRRYITVDVFTDRAFGGNPLAVVLDAGGLSTEQMQAVAQRVQLFGDDLRAAAGRSRPRCAGAHLHGEPGAAVCGPPECRHRLRAGDAGGKAAGAAAVRGRRGPRAGRDRDRAGQGRQHRIHRAAAAEADVASSASSRRRRCLRCRPATSRPTGIHRRSSRSGCRSWLSKSPPARRCGGPGPMPRRSQKPSRATAATPSTSTRATCRPAKSRASCRRGCSIPAPADCPKIPRPAARRRPARRCSPISMTSRTANCRLKIGQGVDMGRPSLLLTRVRKQNGAVASIHVGGSCVKMMEGTFRLGWQG